MFEHNGGMFFGGGFMWLFWVGIIVVIAYVIKVMIDSDKQTITSNDSPMKILEKRYANGEIDDDEYEQKRKQLDTK